MLALYVTAIADDLKIVRAHCECYDVSSTMSHLIELLCKKCTQKENELA